MNNQSFIDWELLIVSSGKAQFCMLAHRVKIHFKMKIAKRIVQYEQGDVGFRKMTNEHKKNSRIATY